MHNLMGGWWLRLGVALILAGLFAATYNRGYNNGANKIKALWYEQVAKIERANAAEVQRARQRESDLRGVILRQGQEYENEVARINAVYQRTLDGLRDRPEERAADSGSLPEATGTEVGSTGAGLAGPDARFLAGYAADAAKLQAALNQCVAAYDEVRKTYGQEESQE